MTCIVTLGIDPDSHRILDSLRRAHFPPERNFLEAHVTLFHALPSDHEPLVRDALACCAAATPSFAIAFGPPRFLGHGVALDVAAGPLPALRRELAGRFREWLTPQDAQPFRPHVTVQNKVAPDDARRLHAELLASWRTLEGRATALRLWRYLGGPWAHLADFELGAAT